MKNFEFEICTSDLKKAKNFVDNHNSSCFEKHHDSVGSLFSYTFTPTGIGTICKIKCACGQEIVLTGDLD